MREVGTYQARKAEDIRAVVVHHIEVSQEDPAFADTPADIERFFAEHPVGRTATGGRMPYPILIDASGKVTQTVPLVRITPHAKRHNPSTVGVACVGDFRGRGPTVAQREALVNVCADLLAHFALDATALVGHDELSGASSDPTKECPGAGLVMATLRRDVTAATPGRFEFR